MLFDQLEHCRTKMYGRSAFLWYEWSPKANASCKLYTLYQTKRNERRRTVCPALQKNAWIELEAEQNVQSIRSQWYDGAPRQTSLVSYIRLKVMREEGIFA